ncbi:transposase [Bradyrhizobium sp. 14AA]
MLKLVVHTGRRRRWTDEEKRKIALESLLTPRAVSSTARRYGISRSLLLTWRLSFGTRTNGTEQASPGFVPTTSCSTRAAACSDRRQFSV